MREILFRGKRCDNGELVEGAFLDDRGGAFYICPAASDITYGDNGNRRRIGCWYKVDPVTVGQYTGLTDKNGKKIFEGDIIEWFAQGESEHPDFGYIEYDEQSFAWRVCWQKYDPDFMEEMQQEYISVIGNIHDNPNY